VRSLRQLHDRAARAAAGRFLIDGVRLVEAALAADAPLEQLLVAPGAASPRLAALVEAARARGIRIVEVAPHVLEAISEVESPQGVVAVVRRSTAPLEEVLGRRDLLLLVVDRVQDPGNLGTMIRTADGAGAHAVALTPGTVDATNPKAARATMGSLFHLPVAEMETQRLLAALRDARVRLLAADVAGTVSAREADWTRPLAVAVGSEAEGLAPPWREAAAQVVRIPLVGRADSLNVAVAAAILLYEASAPVYTEAQSAPRTARGR